MEKVKWWLSGRMRSPGTGESLFNGFSVLVWDKEYILRMEGSILKLMAFNNLNVLNASEL
jgi:hypothetical protein